MALDTFANLKSSVANWLHREGLTSIIPDFITLVEADLNRRLRVAQMEVRATASFDEGYENLPEDFLELREVKVNSSPVRSLQYMTPAQMTEFYPTLIGGIPEFYTLVDSQIRMNKIPTSEVEIAYYAKITPLSDDDPTNWLLTSHPDVYLYGSLSQAEPYLKNDKRMPVWKALYEKALSDVDSADKSSRWSGATLQMRAQ